MIDTHSHLYSKEFENDIQEVVARAKNAGVKKVILPSIDSESFPKMLILKENYPDFFELMSGLHPCYVNPETVKKELEIVENNLKNHKNVAVGEIGIDLFWDKKNLKTQQDAFVAQIRLAKKYNLPFAIHCRDAFDEVFEILESEKNNITNGVFHCFTGNLEQAKKATSYNLKLGIGGVVTFKNGKIDKFLNQIPLEHLVLETDAPYLAPSPFRGKRNESSHLGLICDKLSDIYEISPEKVSEITTKSALQIFNLK